MKKILLLPSMLFILLTNAFSQSCLPLGYDFLSQWDIDTFQQFNPGCTEIEGDVVIRGDDITNLEGLSVLTSIDGMLLIGMSWGGCPNLESLEGLRNLQSVSGILQVENCDKLIDLTGLNLLETNCCGILITYNDKLKYLNGLNGLKQVGGGFAIYSNNSLQSLNGLDSLESVEYYLDIFNNDSLTSLEGLGSLKSIDHGGMKILRNDRLEQINALQHLTYIGKDLSIEENPLLISLHGLEGLDSIPDGLYIIENAALNDFSGLENLVYLGGDLEIMYDPSLSSLEAFQDLNTVMGDLRVSFNINLPSLSGLDNVDTTGIEIIDINNNDMLSICNVKSICDYLAVPNEINEISGNASGCASESEVIQACIAGISDQPVSIRASIWPNPADKSVNCEVFDLHGESMQFIIFDLTGRICLSVDETISDNGLSPVRLDVSELPPGIYSIRIATGDNIHFISNKLIIRH